MLEEGAISLIAYCLFILEVSLYVLIPQTFSMHIMRWEVNKMS